MKIEGRVAIVTGAASGIGRAIAEALAQRGAKGLALVDRAPEAQEVAARIGATGTTVARGFVGDTTDAAFRREVCDTATREFGLSTICVPAAGITRDALAAKIDKTTGQATI